MKQQMSRPWTRKRAPKEAARQLPAAATTTLLHGSTEGPAAQVGTRAHNTRLNKHSNYGELDTPPHKAHQPLC